MSPIHPAWRNNDLVSTHRNGNLGARCVERFRMLQPVRPSVRSVCGSLLLIAVVVGASAAAFAYTAGWFSPHRLTADKMVDAFNPPTGAPLGHRKNHAKGICFTG